VTLHASDGVLCYELAITQTVKKSNSSLTLRNSVLDISTRQITARLTLLLVADTFVSCGYA
jgi:hypothetical protein